jgi:hypothetical protein
LAIHAVDLHGANRIPGLHFANLDANYDQALIGARGLLVLGGSSFGCFTATAAVVNPSLAWLASSCSGSRFLTPLSGNDPH